MTVPIEQMAFKPSGTTTARSLSDWSTDFGLNVKNFGAKGDGITDDTAAIQACFNAAFGSSSNPHGSSNPQLNSPVYFPAGNYLTGTVRLTDVYGGLIYGAGSVLQLNPASSAPPAPAITPILAINGFSHCVLHDIAFVGYTTVSSAHNIVGMDLDWDGTTGLSGLEHNLFYNVGAQDLIQGFLIGKSSNGGNNNLWDLGGSIATTYAFHLVSKQATCNTMLKTGGASITAAAVWVEGGSILLMDTGFSDNPVDIIHDSTSISVMIGGRTESHSLATVNNGKLSIIGWMQPGETGGRIPGAFVTVNSPGEVILDACSQNSSAGGLAGNGTVYMRSGTGFSSSSPWASFTGQVREYDTVTTFDLLPPAADGLEVNVTDAVLSGKTWGDNITAGSSTGHAMLRWNSSNWTLVGI